MWALAFEACSCTVDVQLRIASHLAVPCSLPESTASFEARLACIFCANAVGHMVALPICMAPGCSWFFRLPPSSLCPEASGAFKASPWCGTCWRACPFSSSRSSTPRGQKGRREKGEKGRKSNKSKRRKVGKVDIVKLLGFALFFSRGETRGLALFLLNLEQPHIREREIYIYVYAYMHTYIYIYIYIRTTHQKPTQAYPKPTLNENAPNASQFSFPKPTVNQP